MKQKEIIVVSLIFVVLIVTGVLIWNNLSDKIYRSPDNFLLSPDNLPLNQEFCFDSDEGIDYFNEGVVVWGIGDGEFHRSRDYCVTVSNSVYEEGTLFEMNCIGNSFKIKDVECPNGCIDGICK